MKLLSQRQKKGIIYGREHHTGSDLQYPAQNSVSDPDNKEQSEGSTLAAIHDKI